MKRTDSEAAAAGTPADAPIAVQDAPPAPASSPEPAPQADPPPPVASVAQSLPAALEPELRKIIDTAVARVAAIELEAIKDARELTQRSEQEAREALAFALDRAFNLIRTLELLAATVSGMADALKIELNDAIAALKSVPEPESELAREMAARQEAAAQPEPEPQAEVQPAEVQPEPAAEPAPEPAAVVRLSEVEQPQPADERPPAAPEATNGTPHPPVSEAEVEEAQQAEPQHEAEAEGAPEHESRSAPQQPAMAGARIAPDGGPPAPARRRGFMRRLFRQ